MAGLDSPEGLAQFVSYRTTFETFYRHVEPDRFEVAARDAAINKIEKEQFMFPDFGVWMLERHKP